VASRSRALAQNALLLLLAASAGVLAFHLWGAQSEPEVMTTAPEVPSPSALENAEARSLDVGGMRRTFLVHRSGGASAGAPLWLVLHGSGGSGEEVRRMHGGAFNRVADRERVIVAYPDGYEEHWNDCRPRADYAANLENVDDVGFLRALVESLHLSDDVDLERVTVIGISNGGQMVFRLAREAPEFGWVYVALLANLPAPGNDDCANRKLPVPMLLVNGSEDPINPAQGGLVSLAGNTSRGAVLSARETAEVFARLAGHTTAPDERRWPDRAQADGTSIESSEWRSLGRPKVAWIRVVGGGHSVPTTATLPEWPPAMQAYLLEVYGRQSREFETAEVVWRFSSSPDKALL
jgi:polyhydroxybutyrate depolymerase